ncbi:MAG TPA: S4 domain-containing protein [Burkholderiales bacterium]|nr:S4 domain-containing protein [Burkholderiales bacterium]
MDQFTPHDSGFESSSETHNVRVDKWLWAARFYKTRALAIQGVDTGRVLVNGDRVKPAKSVHVGDTLAIRRGPYVSIVVVKALSLRRGPAADAQHLFEETPESVAARQEVADRLAQEPHQDFGGGRPTKRARRQITRFSGNY